MASTKPQPLGHAEYEPEKGILTITFLHLTPSQVEALWFLMTENRAGPVNERSNAGAHLGRWEPRNGLAQVHCHKPEHDKFVDILRRHIKVDIDLN